MWRPPPAFDMSPPAAPFKEVTGRNLVNTDKDGSRARHPAQAQVAAEGHGVKSVRGLAQWAHLGREAERLVTLAVVQRFDTQSIARKQEAAMAFIPNRKCKHAAQMLDHLAAVLFVEMDKHLGVAAGSEPVSCRLKPRAQIGEVVNLAVKYRPDRAVLIRHWLIGMRRRVDDSQSCMPKHAIGPTTSVVSIRTAMALHFDRAAHVSIIGRELTHLTRNTAHSNSHPRCPSPTLWDSNAHVEGNESP